MLPILSVRRGNKEKNTYLQKIAKGKKLKLIKNGYLWRTIGTRAKRHEGNTTSQSVPFYVPLTCEVVYFSKYKTKSKRKRRKL